jgi:Homing endonuclease associated repeat
VSAPDLSCAGCGGPLPPRKGPGAPQKWCSERCRKASYGDPCVDCGKRTCYGAESARIPEPRCPTCSVNHLKIWTCEAIVCAIQEWAAEYGEPPAICDWNAWQSRALGDEERARRYEAGKGRWPCHQKVYQEFGSWNAAVEAAGFEGRAAHGGNGNWRRRRAERAAA